MIQNVKKILKYLTPAGFGTKPGLDFSWFSSINRGRRGGLSVWITSCCWLVHGHVTHPEIARFFRDHPKVNTLFSTRSRCRNQKMVRDKEDDSSSGSSSSGHPRHRRLPKLELKNPEEPTQSQQRYNRKSFLILVHFYLLSSVAKRAREKSAVRPITQRSANQSHCKDKLEICF